MYLCTAFFTWVLIAKLAFIGEKIDFFWSQSFILDVSAKTNFGIFVLPLTTSTATTTNISALSPSPLFHRVSHVPIVRNRNHRSAPSKMTCNSANGDPNSDSTSDIRGTMPRSTFLLSNFPIGKLDWRNVLLGIGGLYGAAGSLAPLSH